MAETILDERDILSAERGVDGIGRCADGDTELVTAAALKEEIAHAFRNYRAFWFYPDRDIVARLKGGEPADSFVGRYTAIKNDVFQRLSEGDHYLRGRLVNDARLGLRVVRAIEFVHRALAVIDQPGALGRRFVLIKEQLGSPTLLHVSAATTVISHVGPGPDWEEISSIYLGLNIFDVLRIGQRKGDASHFETFCQLLTVEERAIETGYSHVELTDSELYRPLDALIDEILRVGSLMEREVGLVPEEARFPAFDKAARQKHLKLLNARLPHDELNFHYDRCVQGIESLEEHARQYKGCSDATSLQRVVELLVSASGHDVHEVRDRANVALERIFCPKEYDAPLATTFATVRCGDSHTFRFPALSKGNYYIRLYRNSSEGKLLVCSDLDYSEHDLTVDLDRGELTLTHTFERFGQVDYVVFRKTKRGREWLHEPGFSGRINVVPDVRGEIILEIFVDIHGHTRVYWGRPEGHPGLVYNESGEVIRLGTFEDVAAHLEDLRERYRISAIYLLGVQRRGQNRENWAEGASSPSPFSPMSLTQLEPALGGEDGFRHLVERAHELDIKVIVDVVPHLNRRTEELSDEYAVQCYDSGGNLVIRAASDGRYGSWDDGKLLNYRKWGVWEWLISSVETLIEAYGIDGIRFDSAHAVPVMMKKNNDLKVYYHERDLADMVEGRIIVNDRENDDHFITTGYYDSACRDVIAVPFHHHMMARLERTLRRCGKDFFINLAECYWGHERFLTRSGIIPYNSALFKICENITHGKSDVREIYHVYDRYFPTTLADGAIMLGILGNHDERRALNTFGQRGLRAAVGLTIFLSDIVMDYEGNAEGESWKVYLDNIYVNWNQFESVSHRSLDRFYRQWFTLHRDCPGRGYVLWANNNQVAAAVKVTADGSRLYIGAFNFSDTNQPASLQFDNARLPLRDDAFYRVTDPLYSPITGHYSYFTGEELRVSRINTIVPFTERVKLLHLDLVEDPDAHFDAFFSDSFMRLCDLENPAHFRANFAFSHFVSRARSYRKLSAFIREHLLDGFWQDQREHVQLGLKRICFHLFLNDYLNAREASDLIAKMTESRNEELRVIGRGLEHHNRPGAMVFMAAEMEPFSKSGGLANVVYELPRQLASLGEDVYVITPRYRHGAPKAVNMMEHAIESHGIAPTGRTVKLMIMQQEYEVGILAGNVDGIKVFLLDNGELFDGLYWGITSEEKLRRRIGFARACTELICTFGLEPLFTFTNDAFTGPFNGIVRSDPLYLYNPNFRRTSFMHIIHNGGWQYFDSFHRWENGFDLFNLYNLPGWRANEFVDPYHSDRLNCMATGVRYADRVFTVSPSYAKQVQYACDGLEALLHDVIGISNGIGFDFAERVTKRFAASGFTERMSGPLQEAIRHNQQLRQSLEAEYPELLDGYQALARIKSTARRAQLQRLAHKLMLQLDRGLQVTPHKPLFVMIHRITEQKGWQLLLEASEGIFRDLGYQAILGGAVASGDQSGVQMADGLQRLAQFYPDAVNVEFGFQDVAIPFMAGDFVGMPSLSEPGGLVQLEAFACGNLVIARATGGLRDTVSAIRRTADSVTGNGFLFSDFSAWALYDAMKRAANFFHEADADTLHAARDYARASVFHWDRPARQYIQSAYTAKEIIRPIAQAKTD